MSGRFEPFRLPCVDNRSGQSQKVTPVPVEDRHAVRATGDRPAWLLRLRVDEVVTARLAGQLQPTCQWFAGNQLVRQPKQCMQGCPALGFGIGLVKEREGCGHCQCFLEVVGRPGPRAMDSTCNARSIGKKEKESYRLGAALLPFRAPLLNLESSVWRSCRVRSLGCRARCNDGKSYSSPKRCNVFCAGKVRTGPRGLMQPTSGDLI